MYVPKDADEPQYDLAQICVNGHMINDSALSYAQHNKKHCPVCGAETITHCSACQSAIRGHYYYPEGFNASEAPIPAFCEECARPYPWTESRLEAAFDLADQLGLDIPERTLLGTSIEELVRSRPKAPAAAVRFSNLISRAGPLMLEAFRQIMYNVLSEPVRKMIWP